MNGGEIIAKVLVKHGVKFLFTLSGGHIAPIFVEAKRAGIRIVDVRHEANAVFAADAVARLSGSPGVAAVTAGPGLTNTITAVKNAQLAQSPIILLGGATATILKGKGALQDIDQMALMKPHVKWAAAAKKLKDFAPLMDMAFKVCREGVPGPVFIECPVDLLYDEKVVREWYQKDDKRPPRNLQEKLIRWYIGRHLNKIFSGSDTIDVNRKPEEYRIPSFSPSQVNSAAQFLSRAKKPLFVIGSQAVLEPGLTSKLARAIENIGVPIYLSGMARGLLGEDHHLQMRHKRREALRDADLVMLAGVPCDFRLDYGRHIRGSAVYISVNRSRHDLYLNKLNRRPKLAIHGDPETFILELGSALDGRTKDAFAGWISELTARDNEREKEIDSQAAEELDAINPLKLFRELNDTLDDSSILVADGGDFVATASYTLDPRGPLSWLDPGAFGTLGVGGGFALGAKLVRPEAEVWIIWGDGSSAYSLAEFDTFSRHKIPVIGLIGNDACWTQIARDQVVMLKDDVASVLAYSDYHLTAKGYGADGVRIDRIEDFQMAVSKAREAVAQGRPFLINAIIGKSEFRKGSISM
jgi:thiamine pyrophosphate-dependent acetolactate synthase large subunit-like protein